ncbi:MAG: SPOR domain-containing protein [Sphingomonadaceae bacterium]|nr:SPOR domain-containing protein [Sphingomonadaceae bacterium]
MARRPSEIDDDSPPPWMEDTGARRRAPAPRAAAAAAPDRTFISWRALIIGGIVAIIVAVGAVVGVRLLIAPDRGAGSGTPGEAELIRAPAEPYKVKPANGGAAIEGTGQTIYETGEGSLPQGQIDANAVPETPQRPAAPGAPRDLLPEDQPSPEAAEPGLGPTPPVVAPVPRPTVGAAPGESRPAGADQPATPRPKPPVGAVDQTAARPQSASAASGQAASRVKSAAPADQTAARARPPAPAFALTGSSRARSAAAEGETTAPVRMKTAPSIRPASPRDIVDGALASGTRPPRDLLAGRIKARAGAATPRTEGAAVTANSSAGSAASGAVQLGAFSTQAKAEAARDRLAARYPALTALSITRIDRPDGTILYRLRGRGSCAPLTAAGEACAAVR